MLGSGKGVRIEEAENGWIGHFDVPAKKHDEYQPPKARVFKTRDELHAALDKYLDLGTEKS